MPIYDFQCERCEAPLSDLMDAGDPPPTCCGVPMKRVVSSFAYPNQSWLTHDEKVFNEQENARPSRFDPSVSQKQFRDERRPIFNDQD